VIVEVVVPANPQFVGLGVGDDLHLKSLIEVVIIASLPRHHSSLPHTPA